MLVGEDVQAAITSRSRVGLRVTSDWATPRLRESVDSALDAFHLDWDADPPRSEFGDLEPPETPVATVPPAVVINLVDIGDGESTSERLLRFLEQYLPSSARVDLAEIVHRDAPSAGVRLLELRIALRGTGSPLRWVVDETTADRVDREASAWLASVGPGADIRLGLSGGGQTPIDATELDATLDAKRAADWMASLTAASADRVRATSLSYWSAHVSFISGEQVVEAEPFRWTRHLEDLEHVLQALADLTRSAFVQFTAAPESTGSQAHFARQIWKLPYRGALMAQNERSIEERGFLVDAQGLSYLDHRPERLPAGWTATPFGEQLFRVSAPDPDAWLREGPSQATLNMSRRDLASSLLGVAAD